MLRARAVSTATGTEVGWRIFFWVSGPPATVFLRCCFLKVQPLSSSKRDSCVYLELLHISQDSVWTATRRWRKSLTLPLLASRVQQEATLAARCAVFTVRRAWQRCTFAAVR